jgi:hypothetical protein
MFSNTKNIQEQRQKQNTNRSAIAAHFVLFAVIIQRFLNFIVSLYG